MAPLNEDGPQLDDLFTDTDPTRRVKGAQAPVLFVVSAKGGVGTSTIALAAAELAATVGEVKRVTVVDACPEFGNLRQVLRTSERLPTVYTAAQRRDPRLATIGPDRINGGRPASVPAISFGAILAPGHGQSGSGTPGDYVAAIRAVRAVSDLVVVDAGSLPPALDSKMADSLVVPMLRSACWALLVSNSTLPGLRNSIEMARNLATSDVPRDRTMSLVNDVRVSVGAQNAEKMSEALDPWTIPAGWIEHDPKDIGDRMELGTIPWDHPQVSVALSKVLLRVTGRPPFEPLAKATIDRKGRVHEAGPAPVGASAAPVPAARGGSRRLFAGRGQGR